MDKVFDIFAYLMGKAAGGGGGGGGDVTVESKSISSNGTFTAPPGKAYSPVTVSVPASAVDSGTKSITSNGNNQDVVGYAAVDVAVPNSYAAGDEGKVVSNGQLVAQTAHAEVTSNGTIDTTLNDSVVVNVSGGGGSGVATGTVTPAERTLTMSFDAGLSTITGLLIVPESETPLKSGGKTCVGIVYTPNCYYNQIGLTSNNSGASALAPTTSGSAVSVSVSGTTVTVQVASSTPGYFEAITYRWYAW